MALGLDLIDVLSADSSTNSPVVMTWAAGPPLPGSCQSANSESPSGSNQEGLTILILLGLTFVMLPKKINLESQLKSLSMGLIGAISKILLMKIGFMRNPKRIAHFWGDNFIAQFRITDLPLSQEIGLCL